MCICKYDLAVINRIWGFEGTDCGLRVRILSMSCSSSVQIRLGTIVAFFTSLFPVTSSLLLTNKATKKWYIDYVQMYCSCFTECKWSSWLIKEQKKKTRQHGNSKLFIIKSYKADFFTIIKAINYKLKTFFIAGESKLSSLFTRLTSGGLKWT